MRIVCLLVILLTAACARMPVEEARGTPAEAVARRGFARLTAMGMPLGSAVAIAPDRLLTNAHVVPQNIDIISFVRGDGVAGTARVVARSERMDLALLATPPGFVPPLVSPPPQAGEAVWAAGAPAAGPAVATGRVNHPAIVLDGHGPGFTAQIGALLGYSGGPAVDRDGRLVGLVTALPRPGAAPLLAALSGMDLDGIARQREGREVFFLSAVAAVAEAARIAR
jgi:S1-C subfamily serine protease